MSIPRIYQAIELKVGDIIELSQQAAHYVLHVLRLSVGAPLHLFNDSGFLYQAEIVVVSKRSVQIKIQSEEQRDCESPLHLHLGQAVAKGDKMDWIIQKAVELGVSEISPIITSRTVLKLNKERMRKKLAHWQSVAIHACAQCGRNRIPQIHQLIDLSEWLEQLKEGLRLMLQPGASDDLQSLAIKKAQTVCLLIGAEGGLSQTEIDLARRFDFVSINLGKRVLRVETAALTAVSAMQLLWGDLGCALAACHPGNRRA